jgi:uncharacterized protein (TIGR03435 family)
MSASTLPRKRLKVRSLPQDRMKLVAHTEDRDQQVLALTIWKGNAKLTAPTRPEPLRKAIVP